MDMEFLLGDENVLELVDVGWLRSILTVLSATGLFTLKMANWYYVNLISFKNRTKKKKVSPQEFESLLYGGADFPIALGKTDNQLGDREPYSDKLHRS